MKRNDATVILAGFAHALTWVVALVLVFGPVYQGVSVTAVTPGDVATEPTRFTQTLIGANGLRVLLFLLTPVVLTGLALLTALLTHAGQARRKVLLWVPTVLLLGFCALGIWTIGLFYLPAALALVFSAVLGTLSRVAETTTG
ncbi:MAG: hypothetical protein IIB29_15010 [Chloroflexi bacterium]|nr:hypothetical protein [Chloroflexota bacterium]